MGYQRKTRIHTLTFKDELEGLIVRVKTPSLGRVRQVMAALDADGADEMSILSGALADHIVSWNMEDEGRPVPPSLEEIEALDISDVMELCQQWLDAATGPGPDLGKGSDSGATFPGQPLTMEAL